MSEEKQQHTARTPWDGNSSTSSSSPLWLHPSADMTAEAYAGGKRPCTSCRKSKVRCDRGSPCGRCRRLSLDCTEQVRTKRGLSKHHHAKKAAAVGLVMSTSTASLSSYSTPGGGGSPGRGDEYHHHHHHQHYSMGRSESLSSMHDYSTTTGGSSASSSCVNSPFISPADDPVSLGLCAFSLMEDDKPTSSPTELTLMQHQLDDDQACGPSPLQALVDCLLKLKAQARIDHTKALAILRAWGLSYLKQQQQTQHSLDGRGGLAQQLGRMGMALGIMDWRTFAVTSGGSSFDEVTKPTTEGEMRQHLRSEEEEVMVVVVAASPPTRMEVSSSSSSSSAREDGEHVVVVMVDDARSHSEGEEETKAGSEREGEGHQSHHHHHQPEYKQEEEMEQQQPQDSIGEDGKVTMATSVVITMDPFVVPLLGGATSSLLGAAVGLVCVEGQHRFHVNELFAQEFATVPECEGMMIQEHMAAIDVLGRSISACDRADFLEAVGSALFTSPDPCSDIAHIARVDTRQGESYIALARLRVVVREGGSYFAVALNLQRLPSSSRYLSLHTTEDDGQQHHHHHHHQQQHGESVALLTAAHHNNTSAAVGGMMMMVVDELSPSSSSSGGAPRQQSPATTGGMMLVSHHDSNGTNNQQHSQEDGGCPFPVAWMERLDQVVVGGEGGGGGEEDLWGGPVSGSIKRDLEAHFGTTSDATQQPPHYHHHHHQPQYQQQQQQQQQPQPEETATDVMMLHFLDNLF